MKIQILSFIVTFIISIAQSFAQDTLTVSQGASYQNQVWYSLKNGEVKSSAKNNWDIAFQTSNQGSSILINSAMDVKLWVHPSAEVSDWETFDTTGFYTWDQLYNSSDSWTGAFNNAKEEGNSFDLGWGLYNMITHHVNGNRIFILQTKTGAYKKFYVESLISGVYRFHLSDINHSNVVTQEVTKGDYDSEFIYFDIEQNTWEDRAPNASDWDLTFTQYIEFIPSPYLVTGVLLNPNLTAAVKHQEDIQNFNNWESLEYSSDINTIGHDWKEFDMQIFSFKVSDSTAFFIQTLDEEVYKLHFTGFSGQSLGEYKFTKEAIVTLNTNEIDALDYSVYPNPVSNGVLNIKSFSNFNEPIQISFFNINGQLVKQHIINSNIESTIQLDGLTKGIYLLKLVQGNRMNSHKIIIK